MRTMTSARNKAMQRVKAFTDVIKLRDEFQQLVADFVENIDCYHDILEDEELTKQWADISILARDMAVAYHIDPATNRLAEYVSSIILLTALAVKGKYNCKENGNDDIQISED